MTSLPAQFDHALAPLVRNLEGKIALAVSGGGDSMALLHLAAQSSLVESSNLIAFTVNHGLRQEAAAEASFVEAQAKALGIVHKTLTWQTPSASQSHARDARHRLLASAATETGAQIMLTGHTCSDNIESFLIRARAGSGWYGLAGMGAFSASPVWPEGDGLFVGRPMLGFRRGEVRDWLTSAGADWCDDPSNLNEKYERVRMRRLLEEAPTISEKITGIQDKLSNLRRARDLKLAACLANASHPGEELELFLPAAIKAEALAQALSLCAMVVSGTDRPTRTARSLKAARQLLSNCGRERPIRLTLGGTVIRKSGDLLSFRRETNRPGVQSSSEIGMRLKHICAGLTGAPPS